MITPFTVLEFLAFIKILFQLPFAMQFSFFKVFIRHILMLSLIHI